MPFVNSGFKKIDYRDIIARNAFKPQNLFLTKFFILFFWLSEPSAVDFLSIKCYNQKG